jgi:cytochrome c peroxidase
MQSLQKLVSLLLLVPAHGELSAARAPGAQLQKDERSVQATEQQNEKGAAADKPAEVPAAHASGQPRDAASDKPKPQVVVRGRAGTLERLPPRAEASAAERAKRSAELRLAYSRKPAEWPKPDVDEGIEWREIGLLPKEVPSPDDNPWTKEKARLGMQFFFDPRLSGSGQIACASCHDPDLGWGDGRTTAFGHARKPLRRNTPSILNSGFAEPLFWDGRAASLEEQAIKVMLNPDEMRSSKPHVRKLIESTPAYEKELKAAFDVERPGIKHVAGAIASFERTLVGGRSAFDAFLRGKADALSDEAVLGLDVFRTTARCMNCHHGPTLSDGKLHNLGLSYYGRELEDRGQFLATHKPEHVGRFKTPSLRNVSNTGPYMHNGLFPLRGVLNLYNAGMPTLIPKAEQLADPNFPREKSPHLKPLGLNAQDLGDLMAFLESLAEPRLRIRPPALPGIDD